MVTRLRYAARCLAVLTQCKNLEISFTFGAKREFMLRVQSVKRELLLLRKAIRPLVEIVDHMPKLHSPMGDKFIKAKEERVCG